MSQYSDFSPEYYNDEYNEPTWDNSIDPATAVVPKMDKGIVFTQCTGKTIKEFIEANPNSYIIVSTRSKGLFRLDPSRKSKYEVMFVTSFRDEFEHLMNK